MDFNEIEDSTPLDPDEIEGLIPQHITIRSQLNEWEQANIIEAEMWLAQQDLSVDFVLTEQFVKKLHQRMFNNTWRWAGKFRKTDKNIGVEWLKISIALKLLLDDVQFQLKNQSYETIEIATRFHHRLVSIHCFSNGNGRHARLVTDVLLQALSLNRFSWGHVNLVNPTEVRKRYIAALRKADRHSYEELMSFVIS